jgi:hypothetical protein
MSGDNIGNLAASINPGECASYAGIHFRQNAKRL